MIIDGAGDSYNFVTVLENMNRKMNFTATK